MKLILPCLLALALTARGATNFSASAEYSDVAAAYAASTTGDVVKITNATTTGWTNTLVMNKTNVWVIGPGTNSLHYVDWATNTAGTMFYMTGPGSRLSSFTIDRGKSRGSDSGISSITLGCVTGRVDNIFFNNQAANAIVTYATTNLIDHCTFNIATFGPRALIYFNGGTYGDAAWARDANWGSLDFTYMEDCYGRISAGQTYSFIDGWQGGKVAMRYCTWINGHLSNHGTETSQRIRGARAMEIYNVCITNVDYSTDDSAIYSRGGGGVLYNISIGPGFNYAYSMNSYRRDGQFPPWNVADGTFLWDGAAATTVSDSGVATGGGTSSMADSGKSWTSHQWTSYQLRITNGFTGTSGTATTMTVAGAGWSVNQWAGYTFTKGTSKGYVASNDGTTLTLNSSSYYAPNCTGGGAFVLSISRRITDNTTTTLTTANETDLTPPTFASGMPYEIRTYTNIMDQPGMGQSDNLNGASGNTLDNQDIHQVVDPIYYWGNTNFNVTTAGYANIVGGLHYTNIARPGYVPLPYPHPFEGVTNVASVGTLNVGTLILR